MKSICKIVSFFRAIFYHLWCWWTWWRHHKGWNSCPWMPWFSFLIGWSRDWRCWLYFQHDGCGFKRKCYWERILEQSFDNDLTADPPFLNLFEHLSYSLVWVCKRYLLVVSVLFCFVWKMQIKNGISSSNCCVQYFTYSQSATAPTAALGRFAPSAGSLRSQRNLMWCDKYFDKSGSLRTQKNLIWQVILQTWLALLAKESNLTSTLTNVACFAYERI